MSMHALLRVTACLCLFHANGFAASELSAELSARIKQIFTPGEYSPARFGPARWLEGGAAYTTVEREPNGTRQQIIRYETATGNKSVLVPSSQLMPGTVADYQWSRDGKRLLLFTATKKVWRQNTRGDYWVLDRPPGKLTKLGGDAPASTLMFAQFSPDGERVAYVRERNLYVEEIGSGKIRALTTDGSETTINGTSDWVYEEELGLANAFRWSPNGRSIAYWHFDSTGVEKFALIDNTDSLYPKVTLYPYPKVGTVNSAVKVGVVSVNGGKTKWMEVPGDPRNHYIYRVEWKGTDLAIGQLNRLQNQNTIYLADPKTGATKALFRDEDKAWVEVPEEARSAAPGFQWLSGGKEFLALSERDGWRHAYGVNVENGAARLLTTGPQDLIRVEAIDTAGTWLYSLASPNKATERLLYRTRTDGSGKTERLTPQDQPGTHAYDISPDDRWAFHTYSRFDQPPIVELISLPDHARIRTLADNAALSKKVAPFIPSPVEFFTVAIDGGVSMDGWLLKPRNFDASKRYPLIVSIYGEPASVRVVDQWQGNAGLFHRALADDGYLVASFDNTGTPAPKGREWRKGIYGSVGATTADEQAAGVKALAKDRAYIDLRRVGIWGWSGGGSNTLNCLFRAPDVFRVGVSVAPVPDQKLYDTIYQERYMGLPESNPNGYQKGSAIHFAEGLRGKLLVIHGTGDDNVHFQGTQMLINRLVQLGKPFDFMEYPNRTHAISEGEGTTVHLYTLIARYFEEWLPAGGSLR